LIFSAIFSSSETAITSITVAKIRQVKEKDEVGASILKKIKKKMNIMLATILIGNNLVNIAATAILTELTIELFGEGNTTLIATAIMTILILIFGEITPKTYAAQNPEKIALRVSTPLLALSRVFRPVLVVLTTITNILIRLLGGKVPSNSPFITEEEIRSIVNAGEEEGVIKHQEKEMIESIFDIDDTEVTEVMVPRIDVIAIEERETLQEALDLIITYGHSRIPVYKDTIDNIVGIIYAKDMLPFASFTGESYKNKVINNLIRPAYYVPETKKVSQLLKELQLKKTHMAIVLDEYGGTERIDYIFTPRQSRILDYRVPKMDYSDHYPVIAEIMIKNP